MKRQVIIKKKPFQYRLSIQVPPTARQHVMTDKSGKSDEMGVFEEFYFN